MKTYVFPYFVSSGPGDSIDSEITFVLSDDDAARLIRSAHEEPRRRLNDDCSIRDIHDAVFAAVEQHLRKELESDPQMAADVFSWEPDLEYDPSKPITDEMMDWYLVGLRIGINYPEELQFLDATDVEE